jgi:hypothetical protein
MSSTTARRVCSVLQRCSAAIVAALACAAPLGCGGDDEGGAAATDDSSATTGTSETDTSDTGSGAACVDPNTPGVRKQLVDGSIAGDTTWTCDRVWVLAEDTLVYVTDGTLSVEAGTTVQGLAGSALVIEKSARLQAVGTAEAPIVFTSAQPSPARGDWGGLVLLGEATNNFQGGVGVADGILNPPTHGGSNDAHDCGELRYVRVEWAGFELFKDNELNGISVYSCGTETVFDHIQVHMGLDDGFEAYGGGFDVRYLVVTGAGDDSIDLDAGNRSTFQYVFIQQDPLVGDSGLELSGNGADFTSEPRSEPALCNLTFVGAGPQGRDKSKGFVVKEGTGATIEAAIFTNATIHGGALTHPETQVMAEAGRIAVRNSLFWANGEPAFATGVDDDPFAGTEVDPPWSDAEFEAFVLAAGSGNAVEDPQLASLEWTNPGVVPALPRAAMGPGAADPRCESTAFVGAVDPAGADWTREPWLNFTLD